MHTGYFKLGFDHRNAFLLGRLCLVWIAGLSLGYAAARFYGDALEACVPLCVTCTPSFFGSLSVNFFPLLISAFAVFFYRSSVFPICFLRGLILGAGFGAVLVVYRGAGLMMAVFLMFSALIFAPVMLCYFIRRLLKGRQAFRQDTILCAFLALAIALLDIWVVSPLMVEIINF